MGGPLAFDRDQGGYGFGTVLPNSVVINRVTLEVSHRVTSAAGAALLENLVLVSGSPGAVNSDATEPTALTARTYDVTKPGGGSWTRADLLDGTFTTRLRARTGSDNIEFRVTQTDDLRVTESSDVRVTEESVTEVVAVGFEWDYVRVAVDYTDTALVVQLKQGDTVIATRYLDSLTSTVTDFTFALSAEEVAAITDAAALILLFTSGQTGQEVTAVRVELAGNQAAVSDTTPPVAVGFVPAAGATNVALTSNVEVQFSEEIRRGTGLIVLRTSTNQVVESFDTALSPRVTISGNSLIVDPTLSLAFNTTYFLDIPAGAISDLANNAFIGLTTYSFTTVVDTVGPSVTAYDPAVGAVNVAQDAVISLTFSEAVKRGTGTITLRTAGGTVVETYNAATSPRITVSGNVVQVDPTSSLSLNFTYFLDIPSGAILDLENNPFAGTTTYSFSAASVSVQVQSYTPAFSATDVALDTNIILTFNVPVQRGTGVIALMAAPNQLVETFNAASSNRLTFAGATLTIDPTNTLQYGRVYTLSIPAGAITDLAGVPYAGTTSYGFSTPNLPGVEAWMPGSIPSKGFWVALATSTHARSAVTVELSPAPSRVEYPDAPLGEMIETADGRVVMQQPSKDPRRRSWVWTNFGPSIATYERQFRWLEGLRSRYRQQSGQSPYIYVYDGTTELMNKRSTITRTVSSITSINSERKVLNVADISAAVHPTVLTNAVVDLYVGSETSATQRVSITSATNTALTCTQVIDASVTGTVTAKITWLEPNWWRVRVLDTTRTPLEAGVMKYAASKFTFVIEDPDWTEIG